MDEEVFDKALEKLWTHGGAQVDYAENVSRGPQCRFEAGIPYRTATLSHADPAHHGVQSCWVYSRALIASSLGGWRFVTGSS
jgi:hypothetical protein